MQPLIYVQTEMTKMSSCYNWKQLHINWTNKEIVYQIIRSLGYAGSKEIINIVKILQSLTRWFCPRIHNHYGQNILKKKILNGVVARR